MAKSLIAGLVLALAMMPGCENQSDQAGGDPGTPAQHDEHRQEAGSHDGHEHGPGDSAHEHQGGEQHDLGTAKVGEFDVRAAYAGTITPGTKVDVDLALESGNTAVAAIRIWIGAKDAKGSIKSRAASEAKGYHAQVEVPDPLPAGAAMWVEIETNQGARQLGSFPLRR